MAARFDTRLITIAVAAGASPEARSKALAAAAKAGVAGLVGSGQASPKYTRFVDGVKGAPEDAVKPDGTIAYQFAYMGEVVAFALAFLQQRSPSRSGRYRRSFFVAVDGRPIAASSFKPEAMTEAAEVFVYNTQPYSRKVDVQLIGTKPLRFSVPAGLFDDAAKAVNSRFGNILKAERLYTLKFPGQATTKREQVSTSASGRRTVRAAGRNIEYPALSIVRR